MFYVLMFEFMLLGVIGGLLGIFYRNCLKVKGMIFYPLYSKVFVPMVESRNKFLRFIAYPLGFCIYYSTTWITFFLCLLFLTSWEVLPKWQDIVIGVIAASGVQHLVVCAACRWLISNHPDLDKSQLIGKKKKKFTILLQNWELLLTFVKSNN